MYERRVTVRGIIYKDGKIFAQKLKNKDGVENNYWSTPGGGVDDGEDLLSALHREMIEETGITPEIGHLLCIQQFHDGSKEQLEFFFYIKNANDYEHTELADTSHGTLEVSQFGFINPLDEQLLPTKLQSFDFVSYITRPQPPFFINELPVRF